MPELLITPVRRKRPSTLARALESLRTQFSIEEIKAALISLWIEANDHASHALDHAPSAGARLAHLDSGVVQAVQSAIQGICLFSNLTDVENAFENLIADGERKENGIVYTPTYIAEYLVAEGFKLSQVDLAQSRFCDPCCGGAAFVLTAANFLHRHAGVSRTTALREHIWGFDLNPIAVEDTQCLAEMFLLQHGEPVPRNRLNFHVMDALLSDQEKTLAKTGAAPGFDVVATNPPYVKLQNLTPEYRAALTAQFQNLASGSFSLAMLFLIAAQRWLTPKGILAIITQNNVFSSLAAEEVRRQLQHRSSVRRIVDFGHNRVFANASAYTCLIFCGREPVDHLEYESVRGPVTAAALPKANFTKIETKTLDPVKWRLAGRHDLENLRRIENCGVPLGEIAAIRVGFATLKDRVFLLTQDTSGACCALGPDESKHAIEPEITRPAVKIADFDSESELAGNRLRIICPYEKHLGRHRLIDEGTLAARFPLAHGYLSLWRSELMARDKGKKSYEAWYAWGRTQGLDAPGPKLLTKTFSRGPRFMLETGDSLFCNGYAVFSPRPSLLGPTLSIQALQRILNSVVMFYYSRLTSFQIEGGFECYQKNFIERFGIPNLSPEDCEFLVTCSQSEADVLLAKRYGIALQQMLAVTT
jgi:methylase of polypeptide subunit release factors